MRTKLSVLVIQTALILIACLGCQSLDVMGVGYRTLASVVRCQPDTWVTDGIIGGTNVGWGDPDEKLVTQLMIWRDDRMSICTGSLLSDTVVLTAAHCVSGVDPGDVEARFLSSDGCPVSQQQVVDLEVEKIIVHEKFDGTPQSFADLALLRLKIEAPKSQTRLAVLSPQETPSKDEIKFLGFGITDEKKKDSRVLRRVSKSLERDLQWRERTIVVQQMDGKGFCRGDSGAPLLAEVWGEPRILGVNSANVGLEAKQECHTLSLAMDVRHFAPWISDQSAKLSTKTWWEYLSL